MENTTVWAFEKKIPKNIEKELVEYPALIRDLLFWRGIHTHQEAEIFLNPDYERDLHDPFLLSEMDRAVERILRAIQTGEKIVIQPDYDADGIPGGVLMHDFFTKIGFFNFDIYIPHRHEEGYGLNEKAIRSFSEGGASLLITIDCGISNVKEVELANALGIDVVVTDHHLPQEVLPPAYAVVNPNKKGDSYPNKHLCGGGVAFKLVQALIRRGKFHVGPEGWEKWLLDVAGISTMSDMVALSGENRAIAYFGIRVLRKTKRPGLLKLFRETRVDAASLTEEDVGFVITPHINAASRMDAPEHAFHLLATRDFLEAHQYVSYLKEKNNERKVVVQKLLFEIEELLDEKNEEAIISLGNVSWRPGVLGLAANRIVEKYKKPVCLWGVEGGTVVRGSCRSDGSVSVVSLMQGVPEGYFLDFGGHLHSGGFSLPLNNVSGLGAHLKSAYENLELHKKEGVLRIDKELALSDVTWDAYALLERLSPFGIGNRKPLFLFKGLEIVKAEMFGKEKNHLKILFKKGETRVISAIKFFAGDSFKEISLSPGAFLDVAAHIERNAFYGRPELRLRLVDLRRAEQL